MGPQTRLPSTGAPRGRGAEVSAGLAALLGVIVLVAGIPIGLWLFAGAPWAPSFDGSIGTDNASVHDVMVVLTTIVWLAWAYFCVCLLVEAVAEGRGGRIAPRLLGGGAGLQTIARQLVAAVVLIGGTTVSASASSHPITTPALESTPAAKALPAAAADAGDGGDSARSNGTAVTAQPGLEGTVAYYDVRPSEGRHYETLWDIADRFLGSGLRHKEIFSLNKDVVQPDGRTMTSTGLIQAGWILRMPSDAKGAGLRFIDHSQEALDEVADVVEDGGTDEAAETEEGGGAGWTPLYGVAGGFLAAGLAAGLRRYRAGATVGSLASRRLDPPPNGAPSSEAALRNEADPDGAALLSRCLRSWTAQGVGVPPVAQCSVSYTGVAVSFHGMPNTAPPSGWQAIRDGHVWAVGHDEAAGFGESSISPVPGLVTFGVRDDGSTLLMDLDAFRGLVSIGGDELRARAVAISFALDAATHRWADRRQVTMVGFADDITAVAEGSIRVVDDLQRAVHSVERVAAEQRQACARLGVAGVHEARFSRPDQMLWQHHLVVCSGVPSADSLATLNELASDVRASIAVVIIGDVPTAAARLIATGDGRLTSQPIGLDVQAQAIDVEAYRGIVDVYQRTRAEDSEPDGPEHIGQPVDITTIEPELLDNSVQQPVEVRVLGPGSVAGTGELAETDRDLLTEIAVFVALQRGGVHPDALTTAIWPRGIDDATRDASLAQVATWLGEGRFRQRDGLWWLDGPEVRVDWDIFRAYLDHAERMPSEAVRALTAALELVTGEAWSGVPAGRYAWLAYDSAQVEIPALVIRTARRLAATHAQRGEADAARDALLRGLRMAPASEQLWREVLRLASQFATQRDVKLIADQMYSAIGQHGSPAGARAETVALVEQLLPGYRHSAA